ncbi:site-specific integrase [Pedobacter sp. CCM 8938]|uniref:Site-specific integrase n=2 Tax=Pedobacter fastidiosus TaxID=2765361 RepID=A0ABR7KRI9_9SPHI|nr:site-specific integrase [Pedobacter fastidiosus]
MQCNVSLLFYLKKQKSYKDGPMAIYIRFTVDGQRAEVSTGKFCDPMRWNPKSGRAVGTKEGVRVLNRHLDSLNFQFQQIHQMMEASQELISAGAIRARFTGKSGKVLTLVSVFEEHNKKMESLIGQEFEKSTYLRYKTCLMHVRDFMKLEYKITDLPVSRISFKFLTDFEYYLRSTRKCANNSAIKYIKNMGKIVRICLGNGWLTVDPYINYKPKVKKVNRVVLCTEELARIRKSDKIRIERLKVVRDIFLFSCYTGLAYVDVQKLKRSEIQTGVDGGQWILTSRKKTDTLSRIPLLPEALEILERYLDSETCIVKDLVLPVPSNQKMNAYLKEIGDLCEIGTELTFHIARHTFATTVTLNNGVPIESVSKMMGHTSIKTTQIYAKVMDAKIGEDMRFLREKLAVH